MMDDFEAFLPLGTKLAKQMDVGGEGAIFKDYSIGVSTNRDEVVYDFQREALGTRMERFCDDYNAEVARYESKGGPADVDSFLGYDKVKWSETLKRKLAAGQRASFDKKWIREAFVRPFSRRFLFYDPLVIDRPGMFFEVFPTAKSNTENRVLCCTNHTQIPFSAQMTKLIPDAAVGGRAGQCFPFYTYATDGSERRENITDWALQEFQTRYGDPKISKWDIFHYVYAVLHHPQYRERYAANLRRELPRIPFVRSAGVPTRSTSARKKVTGNLPGAITFDAAAAEDSRAPKPEDTKVFHGFAAPGKRLAELHVGYEQQPEFPLHRRENPHAQLNWRVEKMRLSKDKSSLAYNEFLTLEGIPPETFEYRLGNRSALEWVIDQYQVSTDKRSGITNDPNRPDDPEYIVRLLGQVITVSLETVKVVKGLPTLGTES